MNEETTPPEHGVDAVTRYVCRHCKAEYAEREKAEACAAQGWNPTFKPGDIVTCQKGYGWHNGEELWVADPVGGYLFHGNPTQVFYYVVTAVDYDRGDYRDSAKHRPRYHLLTKAIRYDNPQRGESEWQMGYTFDKGHATPVLVENPPPALVEESRAFIGLTTGRLI